jgi:hypothetical protein
MPDIPFNADTDRLLTKLGESREAGNTDFLDAESGRDLKQVIEDVLDRAEARGLPDLTDEEIMAEVEAVRRSRKLRMS